MANSARSPYRALARGVLGRTPWFSSFDSATLDRFVDAGTVTLLKRGDALCHKGDAVASLCVMIDGTLEVSLTAAGGKRHIVTCLEPGQLMNLIPVLDDQPALHDAYAREAAWVLLIPKQIFIDAIERQPGMVRSMAQVLCLRSRALYETVSDNALSSLRARSARMLLTLMAAHGQPRAEGMAISLKLSQDEFADMLGRSRQSVNRELKQLEREGIIQMTYSHFLILDQSALSAIVRD